ncbi:hypothetical protein RZE82_02370 [Mollicutes bacterium LVI A0039]|nr:hypothetical protein RZE82_02370 [Mollicutes bacterium LVI A0039]
MKYYISEANLKGIKIAFWWNAIVVTLNLISKPVSAWNSGASNSEAMAIFFSLAAFCIPILILNYMALKKMQTAPSDQAATFGIILAAIGVFALNILGSIVAIIYYIKIKKGNKVNSIES